MFPATVRVELEHCLAVSEGNLEKAAQIVLYRQETGTAITTDMVCSKFPPVSEFECDKQKITVIILSCLIDFFR